MRNFLPLLLACCFLFTSCYQARMTTGLEPSDTVVEKKWASSFLYGLVPATVDVSDECTHGIASAERIMTFPNMLVSTLTLNIFTPQSVTVTCAAGGSMATSSIAPENRFTLSPNASKEDVQEMLTTAYYQSVLTNEQVRVQIAE